MNKTNYPRSLPLLRVLLMAFGFIAGALPFALGAEANDFSSDMARGEGPPPPLDRADAGPPMRGPHPLLRLLDQNDDQIVSADEVAAAGTRLLKYDENGDGALSESELLSAMPPPGPPPGGPPRGRDRRGPPRGADF